MRLQLIEVSDEKIAASILQHVLPAVCLDDKSAIKVVNISPDSDLIEQPYVAISHIWADGLGNPSANAIHLCQLRLIQERVDALAARHYNKLCLQQPPGHMPFWMDTLCVPAHEGEAKTMAIASMETIYKKAVAVLVLDRDLLTLGAISPLERAVRIAASPWNTRLWTIQEGAFARTLYFQFKDYAVSPEELGNDDHWMKSDNEYDISRLLIKDALSEVLTLSSLGSAISHGKSRHLFQNIGWRFSSRSSDEAICLAILLGLDVGAIADETRCAVKDRMRELIKQQKVFPSAMIFMQGKRFIEPGFRWALATYLGRTLARRINNQGKLPSVGYGCTMRSLEGRFEDGKGLHVTYPGLWLTLTEPTPLIHDVDRTGLYIRNETGGRWKILALDKHDTEPTSSAATWDSLFREGITGLAVILPRALENTNTIIAAILVRLCGVTEAGSDGSGEAEFYCEYVTSLAVLLRGEDETTDPRKLENRSRARSLAETQKWCVG